jgi:hypothetical protein
MTSSTQPSARGASKVFTALVHEDSRSDRGYRRARTMSLSHRKRGPRCRPALSQRADPRRTLRAPVPSHCF